MTARRRKPFSLESQLSEAEEIIRSLATAPAETRDELQTHVRQLIRLSDIVRELADHHRSALIPESSARWRILSYLRLFEGTDVDSRELNVISGIQEHARRVRELRVEYGFAIDHRGNDKYRLISAEPNEARAAIWRFMNELRNEPIAIVDAWSKLFMRFPHEIITKDHLHYIRPGADLRRVRELRTDRGYRIVSRLTGRPDLKPGQYVLVDVELLPESDRDIADAVQVKVLQRDASRCCKAGCGWHPRDIVPGDPRQYIEIHHIQWHVHGGTNDLDNLATLCNVHHKEVHRQGVHEDRFAAWLASD